MYFFLLLSLLPIVAAGDHFSRFEGFIQKYGKQYNSVEEFNSRFEIYRDNMEFAMNENARQNNYTLGETIFSDLNLDEFHYYKNNYMVGSTCESFKSVDVDAPVELDWREKGAVTPVKDQGQCGSCWAFSTIQAVESATAIKYGTLPKLSEQELVDCDTLKNGGRDHGCNGGLMDNAFNWIGKSDGVCDESSYPYTSGVSKTSGTCTMKSCTNTDNTDVINHVDVQVNSDSAMMTALSLQPVSVAIEADQKTFQLYSSGVFVGECGTSLDHGVGLVGYGTMGGVDYYILRNSWGNTWGDGGYMYLGRGNDPATGKTFNGGAGQCGVLGQASYPVV